MKDATVQVPYADYKWFEQLMLQNGWTMGWVPDTERPDYVEE